MKLIAISPSYRSLFYWRTDNFWLDFFAKKETNLYFVTPSKEVEPGLVFYHGYSTIINAKHIGKDCQIWHNVTIGKKSTAPINDKPTIGDNCSICTGAIVVGDISIGNNTIIGANATVVKDVPENCVVVNQAVYSTPPFQTSDVYFLVNACAPFRRQNNRQ